ncbi:MAG: hypothetical protein M3252_00315 [Actinomycetota bacterium]|nr:hypothetical protein [Actinomycetota bacterium]
MLQFLSGSSSVVEDRSSSLVGRLQFPSRQGGHTGGVKGACSLLRLTSDPLCEYENRGGDDDDDDDHDEEEREADIPLHHVWLAEFVLGQQDWCG